MEYSDKRDLIFNFVSKNERMPQVRYYHHVSNDGDRDVSPPGLVAAVIPEVSHTADTVRYNFFRVSLPA